MGRVAARLRRSAQRRQRIGGRVALVRAQQHGAFQGAARRDDRARATQDRHRKSAEIRAARKKGGDIEAVGKPGSEYTFRQFGKCTLSPVSMGDSSMWRILLMSALVA